MTLQEVLEKSQSFLKNKGIENPRLDVELLIQFGLKLKNRTQIYLEFDRPLTEPEMETCRQLVIRRGQGEPVAYIVGEKGFFRSTFLVNSNVLIPRPETELLVELALSWAAQNAKTPLKILDLGSGSGCVGISVALEIPESQITFVELSPAAMEVTKLNCQRLGTLDRATFFCGDVRTFRPSEQYDLILGNPPYIDENDTEVEAHVRKFEPHLALFAKDQGLLEIHDWLHQAKAWLKKPGMLAFEIGAVQSSDVRRIFSDANHFSLIDVKNDISQKPRVVMGVV